MAYDERLAERVRTELSGVAGVTERKMMGGLCFMVHGRMCGGIDQSDLFVRMDRARVEAALRRKHARVFKVGGKTTAGFVRVLGVGIKDARSLRSWLNPAVEWAGSLPPKKKRSPKKSEKN